MNILSDSSEKGPAKPILPYWIMDGLAAQTHEYAGFSSGSVLALLHVVLNDPDLAVPVNLLRNSFALSAATHCLRLGRHRSGKADLLDAYYFTRPGDERGPAGDVLAFWLKACAVNIGRRGWQDRVMSIVPDHMQEDVYGWLDFSLDGSAPQSPVGAATDLLQTVYDLYPQEEPIAFLLADIRLAHDLRWPRPFPFFGQYLTGKELKSSRDELVIDAHRAVATAAQEAVRRAYELARRAAQLKTVAPKLRAKGSEVALELFLTELAVAPSSMLAPKIKGTNVSMTSRAARRLCDRLVDLGVVKELTGRSTFRLYGLMS
jgi:hypothetical protein